MSEESKESSEVEVEDLVVTLSDKLQQKMADAYAQSLEENCPKSEYTLSINGESITFKRRKILGKERKTLEALRSKLARESRRNADASVETEDKLYKTCAEFYLVDPNTNKGMTPDQYDLIPFEDIKPILDACAYRTERVIPPLEG